MARRSRRSSQDDGVRFPVALTTVCLVIAVLLVWLDRPDERLEPLSQFRSGFNDLTAPVFAIASRPLQGLANIGPWWRRQGELLNETRQLRREADELRDWRDLALTLTEQNNRYREALNVKGPAARERISAWAVADQTTDFVHSRLISAGRDDAVEPGYPVINLYGLIGRTVDVGRSSSRVLLLTDLNSRVAVMSDRSNARALLIGDNSNFPELEYLGNGPDLRKGDRIVTSGDDNVMPRGLPVGEAIQDRDGAWRVAMFSRNAPIDFVWVWPFEPTPLPLSSLVSQPQPNPDADDTDVRSDDSNEPGEG